MTLLITDIKITSMALSGRQMEVTLESIGSQFDIEYVTKLPSGAALKIVEGNGRLTGGLTDSQILLHRVHTFFIKFNNTHPNHTAVLNERAVDLEDEIRSFLRRV